MNEQIEILENGLASAISKTLENMTFEEVIVVTDPTIDPYLGEDKLWATLPIVEPYSGELRIEIPVECCKVLAEEAYGELDGEPSLEQMRDLVGEIVNTVAGRFLSDLVSSGISFQLGLPLTGQGDITQKNDEVTSILLGVGEYYLNTTVMGRDFAQITGNKK